MAVNITGAKYNARFLASVGTTSLTVTQTVFVQSDFLATQRMVSLHSSTGAFKGIAWVRRWVSGTQLELENQFVDPATGLYVTQVVGDQVFVSKNAVESATTGFAVDSVAMTITVTDNVLMGTAGVQNSVCFYDQNYQFIITNGHTFNGGVSVYGKLMSYDGTGLDSLVWSRECNVRPRTNYNATGGTPAYNFWGTGGTSAHMFFFGGAIGNSLRDSYFIGAQTTNATNGSFAFYGTRIYYACASPSNGGNWSANASRHLLYKTIHEADYTNANLIVWGNGSFKGQYLSFPQFGAGNPIGVFRASSAVTFGADANNRTIVADVGNGAFIDDANNGSYIFINTITPSVSILRFAGGNVPIEFRFSDSYTNLKQRTTLVMQRGDGTVLNSVVNTASSTYTPIVTQAIYSATANGTASPVNFYQTFNYTVKCYGYNVVSGTHAPYTYSLGTAGNGTDLKIGGLINQLVDDNVTLSETNALLLSSKFSINSTTKVITVTANATYDELYDYVIAWNCSSQANALIPNLSQYLITANGTDLSAFATWALTVNTGVTLSGGAKFTKVRFDTITINGTGKITSIYENSVGESTVFELQNISAGSSVCVWNPTTGATEFFDVNTTGAPKTYTLYYPPGTAGLSKKVARELYGYQRYEETVLMAGGFMWWTATDVEDVGITEATLATVQAYTTLSNTAQIYDATANFRLSETGIKLGQLVARDGTYLDFSTFNVLFKDDASAIVGVASGTVTYKALVINESTKYNAMKATPPKTILANDSEQINVLIEDANGDSQITILGGASPFSIYKFNINTTDFPTGIIPDTRTDVSNFVESITERTYRFLFDPNYNYFVYSPSIRSDANIPNVQDGQTDWEVITKGSYSAPLYKGNEIQLASDAPQLVENNQKLDELILKIDTDLDVKVSTRLATSGYTAPHNTEIDAIKAVTDGLTNYDDTTAQSKLDAIKAKTDTLVNTDLTGIATATDVSNAQTAIETAIDNIPATDLTGVALEATSQSIITKVDAIQNTVDNINVDFTPVLNAVDALPTLAEIESGKVGAIKTKVDTLNNTDLTGIATQSDVTTAKNEIISEIGNIDVDLTGVATSIEVQAVKDVVDEIPTERLKNVSTVETTGEQLEALYNNNNN